jgi:TetR/AcrR family transcriptional regulator, tetracycline repressor protein
VPKTKTRTPLSIQLIHQTAIDLIEQDGLEQLSMRSLAKILKVDPMAIYHHIPNKQNLIAGVFNAVLTELFEDTESQKNWQDTLKNLARRFRALGLKHPKIMPSLIASSHQIHGITKAIDIILGSLLEAGFEPKTTIQASDTLFAFMTGVVLLEVGTESKPISGISLQPNSEPLPNVERLMFDLEDHPFSQSFEFGLELLITGIEAKRMTKKRKPRA